MQIVGERTPETIETLFTERNERLDYIKGQVLRKETELDTPSMMELTRELYKEDPARAVKIIIIIIIRLAYWLHAARSTKATP